MLKPIRTAIETALQAMTAAGSTWKANHDAQVYVDGASYAFILLWTGQKTASQLSELLAEAAEERRWIVYEDGISAVVDWWVLEGAKPDMEVSS